MENVLIYFRDGMYIELFCFMRLCFVCFLVRVGFVDLFYKNILNYLKFCFVEILRFLFGLVDFVVCYDVIESCVVVFGCFDIVCMLV